MAEEERIRPGDRPAPVMEHLEELRRRIIWSVLALVLSVAGSWVFAPDLYLFFIHQLERMIGEQITLTAFTVSEVFLLEFRLGAYLGLVFASPFLLYQVLAFVLPALTPTEKRWIYSLLPLGLVLFLSGVLFGYMVLLPITLKFFISTSRAVNTDFIFAPRDYFNLMFRITMPLGIVFELPIVVWLLAQLGVVTASFLRRMWKYALLVIFVIAAFISPGSDVVSQLIMAGPLLLLYEISIWVASVAERRRRRRQAA